MTVEELNALVPEDQRKAVGELIEKIKADANPLANVTEEGFTEQLKGNKSLQKIMDARVTRGIETWQKNNLDKLYQERYAKEHPDETPEQKRIAALEIEVRESKASAAAAKVKSDAVTAFTQAKAPNPAELASLLFDDGREPMDKVKMLSTYMQDLVGNVQKSVTDTLLKNNGRDLNQHTEDMGDRYYSVEQLNNMSPAEFDQNYDKVQESLKYHQSQQ